MLSLPKVSVIVLRPFIAVITRIFDEFNLILQTRKLCRSIQLLYTKLSLPQLATLLNYLNCVIFEILSLDLGMLLEALVGQLPSLCKYYKENYLG